MIGENEKRSGFREKILPDFEAVLQFSLALTRNGRDAVALMHDAMAEAYRSWDESIGEGSCKIWLYNIMTHRFFDGYRRRAYQIDSHFDDNVEEIPAVDGGFFPAGESVAHQNSFLTEDWEEDIHYFQAIAGLPAVFRSAMILSYLEGFSIKEISDLTTIQPHAVESHLDRGRGFLREELFAHLMGDDYLNTVTDRMAASG